MKQGILKFLVLLLVSTFIFYGCSKENNKIQRDENKKLIYTTFFPITYLTKEIVGDKMEIRAIMKSTDEPHSFELKANDMKEITKADLIVYNGANMESFIPDLENAVGDKDKFLNLSQGLTLLEAGDGIDDKHTRINPHTWLSVKNAREQLDTIYKKVASIDPQNEPFYKSNLERTQKAFEDLDKKFKEELSKVKKQEKYFVVSHAAFNYLAHDYGLKQIAVTGISPEEEPSAKQLKVIADFVKSNNINTIFFEGKATPKVAETLAKNTKTKTSTLYTMENLTDEEVKLGYIKLMELNLEALVRSFDE